MKLSRILGAVLVHCAMLFSVLRSHAQGTVEWSVGFDGYPPIPPQHIIGMTYYYENAMEFMPIGVGQFARSGGSAADYFPENGSAYLVAGLGHSLSVSSLSPRFGLVSVDLAEFSTLYQTPLSVRFVGYRPDGSTVIVDLVTDGIIDGAGPLNDFETFYFDSRFWDVTRVEVPTYGWSLDNMVFSNPIPEPTSSALLMLASGILGFRFLKVKR